MLFSIVISIVILQRLIELIIAKRNEKWMRSQGAFEAGAAHYPIMVSMHIAFFISLIAEVFLFDRSLSPVWILFLVIFLVAQVARIWCLTSLGKFWNTKIIILPGADVVQKGPYKWVRHPNYVIVATELLGSSAHIRCLFYSYYFHIAECMDVIRANSRRGESVKGSDELQ